jgi:serine/threonine protein kinase
MVLLVRELSAHWVRRNATWAKASTPLHPTFSGLLPALRFAAQIADALAQAHKIGITHRDLKPSNVMLTKNGAKLMDFGLAKQSGLGPLATALTEMTADQAKLTSDGMLVGTFQYMAPEQLEGKEADARTDIFAFGEMLYEMVTGKPAFSGKSRASLIAAVLSTEPPPITQVQPLASQALERVVKKCLAKDPEERWQSASDLASELKWIADSGSSASAVNVSAIPEASKTTSQRESGRLAWAIAAIALAAAGGVATLHFFRGAKPGPVVRSLVTVEEGTFPMSRA